MLFNRANRDFISGNKVKNLYVMRQGKISTQKPCPGEFSVTFFFAPCLYNLVIGRPSRDAAQKPICNARIYRPYTLDIDAHIAVGQGRDGIIARMRYIKLYIVAAGKKWFARLCFFQLKIRQTFAIGIGKRHVKCAHGSIMGRF